MIKNHSRYNMKFVTGNRENSPCHNILLTMCVMKVDAIIDQHEVWNINSQPVCDLYLFYCENLQWQMNKVKIICTHARESTTSKAYTPLHSPSEALRCQFYSRLSVISDPCLSVPLLMQDDMFYLSILSIRQFFLWPEKPMISTT